MSKIRSFEDMQREITDIVKKLEAGPPLEEALKLYEQGVSLIKEANAFLKDAEKRVTIETLEQPK